MFFSMTIEKTLSGKSAKVIKFQSSLAVSSYYGQIKVHEMAVIDRIPLYVAYSMGVVTGGAWCSLVHYMLSVLAETLISQDAVSVVAFIA